MFALMLIENLKSILHKRQSENTFRSLTTAQNGIDFCSNDYLGFAKKTQQINIPNGSTGSRLISGHHLIHQEAEKNIAHFHQNEAALIFNSGYDANLGFFSTIPQKEDTVIYDQLCHASIRDGLRLGTARNFSFQHNNTDDLRKKIQQAQGNTFVVVESIYSMDGDKAPLQEIEAICKENEVNLIVDEAHATGIFGEKGQGVCQAENIRPFAKIHTFSKALGAHGAAIVGSQVLKDYLINFARPFIYTTALSPHSIAVIQHAYNRLPHCPERDQLLANIALFKNHFKHPNLIESQSPIQCIVLGGVDATKQLAEIVQEKGMDVRAILHPTVAKGAERIRICLHSFNTSGEILQLCKLLNELI